MEPIYFSNWSDLEKYIIDQTGCKPYSGAGICPRPAKNTTILRSVDDTEYYADDLSDIQYPKYTLFGHNGDQYEHEKKFNNPLLTKSDHIYLYRVKKNKNKSQYIWYGKYNIIGKQQMLHPGKDKIMRTIIVLSLKYIE